MLINARKNIFIVYKLYKIIQAIKKYNLLGWCNY